MRFPPDGSLNYSRYSETEEQAERIRASLHPLASWPMWFLTQPVHQANLMLHCLKIIR
jgi:hypothetical protein